MINTFPEFSTEDHPKMHMYQPYYLSNKDYYDVFPDNWR